MIWKSRKKRPWGRSYYSIKEDTINMGLKEVMIGTGLG